MCGTNFGHGRFNPFTTVENGYYIDSIYDAFYNCSVAERLGVARGAPGTQFGINIGKIDMFRTSSLRFGDIFSE